ncbi:acyltransferase family domain protein [Burkholderia pseudomallei MSHR5613]|nr:acyltransferase family domain protein [Burkholderia pseudomallei MSHR5613]
MHGGCEPERCAIAHTTGKRTVAPHVPPPVRVAPLARMARMACLSCTARSGGFSRAARQRTYVVRHTDRHRANPYIVHVQQAYRAPFSSGARLPHEKPFQ